MPTSPSSSMHTSPLAQPGTGDGGGMNVYVRELCAALARSGVALRGLHPGRRRPTARPPSTSSPDFRVHHIPAGPLGPVAKEQLPELVPAWTAGVAAPAGHAGRRRCAASTPSTPTTGCRAWPGTPSSTSWTCRCSSPSTPWTGSRRTPARRSSRRRSRPGGPRPRPRSSGCADAVVASCSVEAEQLVDLYGADPDRIAIVAPGVDHAFFSPGDQEPGPPGRGLAERAIPSSCSPAASSR